MIVYIVMSSFGSYEDHVKRNMGVFFTKKKAEETILHVESTIEKIRANEPELEYSGSYIDEYMKYDSARDYNESWIEEYHIDQWSQHTKNLD